MIQTEVIHRFEVSVSPAQWKALLARFDKLISVGERLVDAIDVLTQNITNASEKLSAEAAQIAEALRQNSTDPQRILAQADRVEAMGNAIAALIPDPPPPDPVEPV